ncbi:hypothetical protein [Shewanella surugensis]|uniref:Uncharacterized protein n=1 Tax=Shewanella surugensis TaxID=212020 RepID=A0ABT0LID2_9GAMM|nr:hypothetical protein [Shewanella surugensis]MCL1127468.1 hypothetical protein [Shewanella surugensis]
MISKNRCDRINHATLADVLINNQVENGVYLVKAALKTRQQATEFRRAQADLNFSLFDLTRSTAFEHTCE